MAYIPGDASHSVRDFVFSPPSVLSPTLHRFPPRPSSHITTANIPSAVAFPFRGTMTNTVVTVPRTECSTKMESISELTAVDDGVYDRGLTQKLLDLTARDLMNHHQSPSPSSATRDHHECSDEENPIQIMMSDDDDLPIGIAPRIGEDDSMSTTLSIPVHDEALQHQTETVSNVSVYDTMHPLDPQEEDESMLDDSPLPQHPKYDAFHREHYEELVIVTASDTSSRSDRVNCTLPGVGLVDRSSSSSLTNNNRSNNHDSDLSQSKDSGGPPVYAPESQSNPDGDGDGDGIGGRVEGDGVRRNGNGDMVRTATMETYTVSEAEHSVFKSLQNKLIEMDDFNRNYLGMRHHYLTQKRKRAKECRVQLNRAKHRVNACFYELYLVLKEQQDSLLDELEEQYAAKRVEMQKRDDVEVEHNAKTQRLIREHMASLSRCIDEYQSKTNDPSGSSSDQGSALDAAERESTILKMGSAATSDHEEKLKYFDSAFDDIRHRIDALKQSVDLEFAPNRNAHLQCADFMRCHRFGRVLRNVPTPQIDNVRMMGNDHLAIELCPHPLIAHDPSSSSPSASTSPSITAPRFEVMSYEVLYRYHCTEPEDHGDEKVDHVQWERVELNGNAAPFVLDVVVDDLNLVNADLVLKVRGLLRTQSHGAPSPSSSNADEITLWTRCSEVYKLTQQDLLRSLSRPCVDSSADLNLMITSAKHALSAFNPNLLSPSPAPSRWTPVSGSSRYDDQDMMVVLRNSRDYPECAQQFGLTPLMLTTGIYSTFVEPESSRDSNEPSNCTVCYHDEYTVHGLGGDGDGDGDTVREHSVCTSMYRKVMMNRKMTGITDFDEDEGTQNGHGMDGGNHSSDSNEDGEDDQDGIDIVEFKKALYLDEDEMQRDMVQHQQLIQQFVGAIGAAKEGNVELVESLRALEKRQELWSRNKMDLYSMRKRPKLSLRNTNSFKTSHSNKSNKISCVMSPRSISQSTATMSPSTSSGATHRVAMSSSFSQGFPTSFGGDKVVHHGIGGVLHGKAPGITEQIFNKLSRFSRAKSPKVPSPSSSRRSSSSGSAVSGDWNSITPILDAIELRERTAIYAEFVHILQENPVYLSSLSPIVGAEDRALWVETVCCHLFGDDADSRNEHLLMRILERMIADYVAAEVVDGDLRALWPGNADVDMDDGNVMGLMTTSFMNERCSENESVRKGMVQRLQSAMESEEGVNLEIDPVRVHRELLVFDGEENEESVGVMSHDGQSMASPFLNRLKLGPPHPHHHHHGKHGTVTTITSNSSMLKVDSLNSDTQDIQSPRSAMHHIPPSPHCLSPMRSERDHRVKQVISGRIEQIEETVSIVMDSLIESAATISFGIRWICKCIAQRIAVQYPMHSEAERDGVIGRVVFSRYIEPALLKGNDDRNASVIAHVLRCILCHESTDSMDRRLREWIRTQRMDTAPLFFEKLLNLEDSSFADRLSVDRQLVECKGDIELSLKQIYILHHAVYCNAEVWNTDNGNQHLPLLDVLDRLEGDAPYEYLTDDAEKRMRLDLAVVDATTFNPFFADNDSEDALDELDEHRLLHDDESYILDTLQDLRGCHDEDEVMAIRQSLKQLLLHQRFPEHIVQDHRHSLSALLGALREWAAENGQDTMSCLVDSVLQQMTRYQAEHGVVMDSADPLNVFVADCHFEIKAVAEFSQRLQSKAVLFAKARDAIIDHTDYLQNKLAQQEQAFEAEKASLKRKQSRKAIKVPFKRLVAQGVIIEDGRSGLDGSVFHLVPQTADSFMVHIKIKSKMRAKDVGLAEEPFLLSMMAVLEMKESNRMQFELGSFTFFVDGVVDFLNGIFRNMM